MCIQVIERYSVCRCLYYRHVRHPDWQNGQLRQIHHACTWQFETYADPHPLRYRPLTHVRPDRSEAIRSKRRQFWSATRVISMQDAEQNPTRRLDDHFIRTPDILAVVGEDRTASDVYLLFDSSHRSGSLGSASFAKTQSVVDHANCLETTKPKMPSWNPESQIIQPELTLISRLTVTAGIVCQR